MNFVVPIFLGLALLVFFSRSFIVLLEYERAVTFWLGKLADLKSPGLRFVFWPFVTYQKISLRTIVHDVPPQDVITRDNVSVQVNAVVYYRVVDPEKAVTEIEDFHFATSQLAQTTLRSVLGQADLDELLSERDKLNEQLQEIVDSQTDPWGIKVTAVEVKHVDLPQTMQRAMARQAEAEREKRAKVIHAEGELQASRTLAEAATEVSKNAVTLQLRYLQTLSDIATERNSTIIFPLPIELIRAFGSKIGLDARNADEGDRNTPGEGSGEPIESVREECA
ncbi:MAG: slipin family protein [Thermoanaerobaculia bacterium]|nr:slipin family protein [Thermoanaerobaculia bacterium]